MKSLAPLIVIGTGILLLVGSAVWPLLFPVTNTWTDEKSQRMKDLATEAAKCNYSWEIAQRSPSMTSGESPTVTKEKYDMVMSELNQMRAEFKSATESPNGISSVLKWVGISVLGAGVICWLVLKGG